MTLKSKIVVAAAAVILSGCGTTQSNFEAGAEAARGSPAYRAQVTRECVSNTSRRPLAQKRNLARVMNVSVARMPETFCRRAIQGIVSGRLTYADLRNASLGQVSPKVVRVLQGR